MSISSLGDQNSSIWYLTFSLLLLGIRAISHHHVCLEKKDRSILLPAPQFDHLNIYSACFGVVEGGVGRAVGGFKEWTFGLY
jgi:hypothetical protein